MGSEPDRELRADRRRSTLGPLSLVRLGRTAGPDIGVDARFKRVVDGMTNQPDIGALDIAVSDFGPIVEANVDLRPLTVFVGPSNTGKSYLAILIYALHRFFGRVGVARRRSAGSFVGPPVSAQPSTDPLPDESIAILVRWAAAMSPSLDRNPDRMVGDILPESVAQLIRPRLHSLQLIENAKRNLDQEIMRCFGLDAIQGLVRQPCRGRARVRLQIRVADDPLFEQAFTLPVAGGSFRVAISDDTPLGFVDMPAWFIRDVLDAHSWARGEGWLALVDSLSVSAMQYALGPASRPVHYLPADRTGIMHAHRVVVGSLVRRASRAGFHQDGPLPALSGVLADFLEQLIELGGPRQQASGLSALATRLEREILKGAVRTQLSETGYPSFLYRPDKWKDDLHLMNTSSMVSELAPVVLYLRDVVQSGDTLIIEEPESHLHPAMQVEFTRLLAAAVKAGIRIIITTHSEWVLEALANLVRLSALPQRQREDIAGADVALTQREVGAWLFKPKKRPRGTVVEEIPLDIEAGTFPAGYGEITEHLYNDWARISNLAQKAADQ